MPSIPNLALKIGSTPNSHGISCHHFPQAAVIRADGCWRAPPRCPWALWRWDTSTGGKLRTGERGDESSLGGSSLGWKNGSSPTSPPKNGVCYGISMNFYELNMFFFHFHPKKLGVLEEHNFGFHTQKTCWNMGWADPGDPGWIDGEAYQVVTTYIPHIYVPLSLLITTTFGSPLLILD